jgi:hypothetical protein
MGEEDFVRFWRILADVDEQHSKKIFNKCVLVSFTVAPFMEVFIGFVSNANLVDESS